MKSIVQLNDKVYELREYKNKDFITITRYKKEEGKVGKLKEAMWRVNRGAFWIAVIKFVEEESTK